MSTLLRAAGLAAAVLAAACGSSGASPDATGASGDAGGGATSGDAAAGPAADAAGDAPASSGDGAAHDGSPGAHDASPGGPDASPGGADASPGGADAGDAASAGGAAGATLGFIAGSAWSMYASVGGGPAHAVQLDTGSLGLYVPKSVLGSGAQVSSTQTCSITYVSSGITLSGHEATAQVALLGSSKTGDVTPPPTTVTMSLCAVDDAPFDGGMMGVGFGRGTGSDPARNVLLQVAQVAGGTPHAGYVLSTHPAPSVQVGVAASVPAGFQTFALTPDPSGNGDWVASSLRGCLALPKVASFTQACGPMLVDTGVADMLLWGPADPTLGGAVPSGQTTVPGGVAVAVTAPADGAILDYAFTVGSGSDSPAAVSIRSASAFSINTGRALLVDYDYLFDAQAGLVGFRHAP